MVHRIPYIYLAETLAAVPVPGFSERRPLLDKAFFRVFSDKLPSGAAAGGTAARHEEAAFEVDVAMSAAKRCFSRTLLSILLRYMSLQVETRSLPNQLGGVAGGTAPTDQKQATTFIQPTSSQFNIIK